MCDGIIVCMCGAVITVPIKSLGFLLPLERDHLGLHLPVGPLRRAVLFGEGFELKRVKGVFAASHILHRVLPPAALAVGERHKSMHYLFPQVDVNISALNALHTRDISISLLSTFRLIVP